MHAPRGLPRLASASSLRDDYESEDTKDAANLSAIVDAMCVAGPAECSTLAESLRVAVDSVVDDTSTANNFVLADHSRERGYAVNSITKRLQSLLTSGVQGERLAAIAAFTALIHTTSESIHARAQRAANALRVLFQAKLYDIATAEAAANMAGEVSRLGNLLSDRAVDNVLDNAINLIAVSGVGRPDHKLLSLDRARSAIVISTLVRYSPVFVYDARERLLPALWVVVWDPSPSVRLRGVRAMQAILYSTHRREDFDSLAASVEQIIASVRRSLASNPNASATEAVVKRSNIGKLHPGDACKCHGSLALLASLLQSEHTMSYVGDYFAELCSLVLPFQSCHHPEIRQTVAELLPLFVALDKDRFIADGFLHDVHAATFKLIQRRDVPPDERGRALSSLGAIASQVPPDTYAPYLDKLLSVCDGALMKHEPWTPDPGPATIPHSAVFTTITHLAHSFPKSPILDARMHAGMLTHMFDTNFTLGMVTAVDAVGQAVPRLARAIRFRLIHLIGATLKKRMEFKGFTAPAQPALERGDSSRRPLRTSQQIRIPKSSSTASVSSLQLRSGGSSPLSDDTYSLVSAAEVRNRTVHGMSPRSAEFFNTSMVSSGLRRRESNDSLISGAPSGTAVDSILTRKTSATSLLRPASSVQISLSESTPQSALQAVSITDSDTADSPCVALKAIGTHAFVGMGVQDLTAFANDFVIGFVESETIKVRGLAVLACAELMKSAVKVWTKPKQGLYSSHRLRTDIQEILAQIVAIAVADPSLDVRLIALEALDSRSDDGSFFPYLLQPEMLDRLVLCIHDENFDMRLRAVSLIARLSSLNPAHCLPALRKTLVHLLTVLRCDGPVFYNSRSDASKLLFELVTHATNLVEPYTVSIMDALLIRMHEVGSSTETQEDASVVLFTIAAMGGMTNRMDLSQYRAELVPLIVHAVLDARSADRQLRLAALRALSCLVQNTGFVIEPYVNHPALLPGLLKLLRRVETDVEIRLEAERLMGVLGAVDPNDYKYAALPDLKAESVSSMHGRNHISGSGGRSLFHRDGGQSAFVPMGLRLGTSLSRGVGVYSGVPLYRHHCRSLRNPEADTRGVIARSRGRPNGLELHARGNNVGLEKAGVGNEGFELKKCISLFGLGGARVDAEVLTYTPAWAQHALADSTLVGMLDHPFTANVDFYFPSAALDNLLMIIANPGLHVHHRDACGAIGNILSTVGFAKVPYFLPAIVPRVLRLLSQSAPGDPSSPAFSSFEQTITNRLSGIVSVAGIHYLPYVFDTVLLVRRFMTATKVTPACVSSMCNLLCQLRSSIGDKFRPIVVTVVPAILSAMRLDCSSDGSSTKAVLRAFDSFGYLLGDYGAIVLPSILSVVERKRSHDTRTAAQITFNRLLPQIPVGDIVSKLVHPLTRILAGNVAFSAGALISSSNTRGVGGTDTGGRGETPSKAIDLASNAAVALGYLASTISVTHFDAFIPVIAKALAVSVIRRPGNAAYDALETILLRRDMEVTAGFLDVDHSDVGNRAQRSVAQLPISGAVVKSGFRPEEQLASNQYSVPVSRRRLLHYWRIDKNFSGEDWVAWMSRLGAAMVANSGSPSFRCCTRVIESYPQLSTIMFNAAFLSCWVGLDESARGIITDTLCDALELETMPLNVLQGILNLFEYMDHDEKPLPVPMEKLARASCRCGAFAKALRHIEQDYITKTDANESIEDILDGEQGLITIYEKLDQKESAVGTVKDFGNRRGGAVVGREWFEQLQKWDQALDEYRKLDAQRGSEGMKWEDTIGKLRCLNEIGRWRAVNDLIRVEWQKTTNEQNAQVANERRTELALSGKGASVAFDLECWEEFEERVACIPEGSWDGCFYRTLLLVKKGKDNPALLDGAHKYLTQGRVLLDEAITARVSEGYPRAYEHIVNAQLLVELEEMIGILRMPELDKASFGMRRLASMWDERLSRAQYDRYTWYRLLMVRALVLKPIDNKDRWLEFAALCRKTKRLPMACEALRMLVIPNGGGYSRLDTVDMARAIPDINDLDIKFACIKHIWAAAGAAEQRATAFRALSESSAQYVQHSESRDGVRTVTSIDTSARGEALAAEVFLKLYKWSKQLLAEDNASFVEEEDSLKYAEICTMIRPSWYKAWHYWASINASRVDTLIEDANSSSAVRSGGLNGYRDGCGRTQGRIGEREKMYLKRAIQGFFKAISYAGKTQLEDTLKVLTLWFNYGGEGTMYREFDEGFAQTNITLWLEVVPQIIARLHMPHPKVRDGVKELLRRIGIQHPHDAVYPLTVAKNTPGPRQEKRREAACQVLDKIMHEHKKIVQQAEIVANELVRVAILWTEAWYEKLEEASKLYFGEGNVNGMLDILLPLHDEIEKGPETEWERDFTREFGRQLHEAGALCRQYRQEQRAGRAAPRMEIITQAWEIYYQVFRKVQRQQQNMHTLDLGRVSHLTRETSLVLAVPGTYKPGDDASVVTIESFEPKLSVIQSKQRPRKLSILGSNGHQYTFLLKGHEDLRQDERVMQLFGLVNKLFAKSDQPSVHNGESLKRYSVTALSGDAGLIEWVPNCDTMHTLVKEYRETRKIMPNIEHKVMIRTAPEPDRLPLLNKVDLFEFMMDNTKGGDIARVLWLKSRSSEMWLDRRTNYARSLAVTSMVGYLLGLGDRHPSNLMIERETGIIMHIDFGDCFEVAMKREKYPEKVPFRLTRMLVNALEPCGVEGYFRHTSEAAMRVLRGEQATDSLKAMMEAFVYDPLIRWKLVGDDEYEQIRSEEESRAARVSPSAVAASLSSLPNACLPVSSLQQTGSLSASLRLDLVRSSNPPIANEELHAGALPTPGAAGASHAPAAASSQFDPAELESPSEQERLNRRRRLREGEPVDQRMMMVSNKRAEDALRRFLDKLRGNDFEPDEALDVPTQVDRLINEARSVENLCQLFLGWCSWW